MKHLLNKNIVLIAPSFFGYEDEIIKKIKEYNANVYYIDDRYKNNTITKILIRIELGPYVLKHKIEKYFLHKLDSIPFEHIDYIVAISPEAFSGSILKIYKEKFKQSKFILYMWDSFINKNNILKNLELFDNAYTFDTEDAVKYNINFLPLFYIDEYQSILKKSIYKFKMSFIGTAHSDRYFLVQKIFNQIIPESTYSYFYFQSKILFIFNKMFNKHFKNIKMNDISYKNITKNKIIDIVSNSEIIIDIHHPNQKGLTMRQIEMLGANKKVITTNDNIEKYDFFNSNNILVIDRQNPIIPKSFLTSVYQNVTSEVYQKYSLDTWLNTILK